MSRDRARDMLERLVSFESLSAQPNGPVIDAVEAMLDHPAIRVERFPAGGADTDDRWNLLASLGPPPDESREGLLLSGHLDVVPARDQPGWTSDPFRMVEREGRFIGRGTADMKGFVALAIDVLRSAAEHPPARPLLLLLSTDEEVGSLGVRRFAETWPKGRPLPRRCLVGEPTSLRPIRMHAGHVKVRYTVTGRGGHSGSPHLGRNAIEAAIPLLSSLSALRRTLEGERPASAEHFPQVPFITLNIARVTGGTAFNMIPDRCVIDVGARPLPGVDADGLRARLAACGRGIDGAAMEDLGENPWMLTREDDPFLHELSAVLGTGESGAAPYASDGGFLSRDLGMACVLFGPGSISVAHAPDESIDVAEWREGGRVLRRIVARICEDRS